MRAWYRSFSVGETPAEPAGEDAGAPFTGFAPKVAGHVNQHRGTEDTEKVSALSVPVVILRRFCVRDLPFAQ